MPGTWKSQPTPGKPRGIRGQDTVERHGGAHGWRVTSTSPTHFSQRAEPSPLWWKASPSLVAPSRPRSWEREKGAAGVIEGPGERSPRSGVRRGRSPSPAPSRVEGRRACLRSRESLLPAAFATCRCLNPVLAAFPRPRSSNRTCRFPASGFQSRSCLRPRKALRL